MNAPQSPVSAMPLAEMQDDDEIDLLGLLDVLLDSRWMIAGVTVLVLLLGGAYAFLSRPVYQANSLIQVEDSKPGAAGALGDAASLFDIKSPATAEMEILRSRLVVAKSVDDLQLYVSAFPKYLPLVGGWLARRATGLSEPGFMGMGGYVSGNESIRLGLLEVPDELQGQLLLLVATEGGFELRDPDGQALVQGKTGTPASFGAGESKGRILVTELKARPGAYFNVARSSRLDVIEELQKDLAISEQGKQSGVIALQLQGSDPQKIARTLDAVGTNYVRQNVERKSAEAEKSLDFLGGFLPQLKKQLEDSEVRFNKYRNQNGTFDLGVEGKNYLDTAVKLQGSLLELQQKRREQSAQFTAAHPVIQTLDAQIAAVSKEIADLTSKVKTLPNTEQDLLRLTRDVKVNSELYLNLLTSSQQLRLVKEGKVGNVRVVDAPVVPERSIKPQRAQILAISGVLGLLLGMGLAFLRNSLRPGIKDPSDIESATGLHVFATVPHSAEQDKLSKLIKSQAPGTHLLAVTHPEDPGVESLRSLRTALQFAMLDARNNVVLFTGPTPGIGKSFTSANFAAVLGAGGKRVLLIDADMRKGHIHQFFGMKRGHGLSELITGSRTLGDVVRRAVAPNLDLITTGTMPPNPGELLMSPTMLQLLEGLSAQYDLVLIDTPPVLAVSDTQVLAPYAGTVFMVARAEVTALGELQESIKRLGQIGVPVKGVVFNDMDTSRQRYGGYGYKYSRYRYTNYQYGKTADGQ
ncbi:MULTISPECIES: polysaccharide biosynthesis tyrosine autokinase [unclassified Polaromonas]|uniref:polysaccharide biosynthesis tyrosine autokinase n=1 Tax=unclassified Polaromonas TaxID=2638319 RepID=UPI0018C93369|nr:MULTISPECIES: polysaccharide biosynthesis tyrosine autokinase [unclassified Polaromonas]MBG6073070.1 tyrosine-protein kinase Etk/Wzc [Polaromonas sp. CG_9.7]MBG6115075.1 tyrosine-protein kinase Etk/Wzc [Polaromonas sp. CG_9.2]